MVSHGGHGGHGGRIDRLIRRLESERGTGQISKIHDKRKKREKGTGQISEVLTTVTLNNQGLFDLLQAAVTGLKPKSKYQLVLVRKNKEPYA
jgi:hypothetical protein